MEKGELGSPFSFPTALFMGARSCGVFLAGYRIGTIPQKFSLATPAVSE